MSDRAFVLSEHSLPGRLLHILVGYDDHPMGMQLLTCGLTVTALRAAMYPANRQPAQARG